MLNEFVYCPRLFYIEYVQGEFEDSADTVEGHAVHRRVEKESGELPSPEESEEDEQIHAKSVLLSSGKHGIIARMDLVEGEGNVVTPVDYKRGEKPDIPEGAWLPERVQICAQALVLRENGYACAEGVIYYAKSKERVTVPITDELIALTLESLEKCRELADSKTPPPPLPDSPKCPRCSLAGICLPDELNALAASEESLETEIRRLYPARDDAVPAYVTDQRALVSKRGDELEVKSQGETLARVRLMEMSHLAIFGNAQITTQAIRELCARNKSICFFSSGGWFYGIIRGMDHKNVELRRKQYAVAEDPSKSVQIARKIVEGKIRNCRTMLRRNCTDVPDAALEELAKWAGRASGAETLGELLGIEGSAGRVYFMHFGGMLKRDSPAGTFDFESRNRRPPKDPVNALLSYVYAITAKDATVTLMAVGFDPYLGFFHRPRYGRPSLALDLMEEFRPIVGDSVVISLVNNDEISKKDFVIRGGAASLTGVGKKTVIRAYERRMDSQIIHPLFGYTVSYRRIIEVQARLLSRCLSGELAEYPMFCTR
ncbi:MAG: CRISPR-associated endonuclease Cas1 [Euryarchaeota archaeon]|nr:CRISPR-associated endonuclease Cas1 [Euryarchaeota archaeon]